MTLFCPSSAPQPLARLKVATSHQHLESGRRQPLDGPIATIPPQNLLGSPPQAPAGPGLGAASRGEIPNRLAGSYFPGAHAPGYALAPPSGAGSAFPVSFSGLIVLQLEIELRELFPDLIERGD